MLDDLKEHKYVKQIKALVLHGCRSGMKAEELYQFTPNDIDLKKIVLYNYFGMQLACWIKAGRRTSFRGKDSDYQFSKEEEEA